MNTYIQDKLDGLRERYKNSESLNPFIDDIEYYFEQSLTDYHNHIAEKIKQMLSPGQRKYLDDFLQDTNPKE